MSTESQIVDIIRGKNGHKLQLPTLLRGMADRLGNFAPSDDLRYAAHKMADEVSKLLQDKEVNIPEYRRWASLDEMVEDGAHEWWFQTKNGLGSFRISIVNYDHECVNFSAEDVPNGKMSSDTLEDLFRHKECSPSPLGPWQPCGRKVSV